VCIPKTNFVGEFLLKRSVDNGVDRKGITSPRHAEPKCNRKGIVECGRRLGLESGNGVGGGKKGVD